MQMLSLEYLSFTHIFHNYHQIPFILYVNCVYLAPVWLCLHIGQIFISDT